LGKRDGLLHGIDGTARRLPDRCRAATDILADLAHGLGWIDAAMRHAGHLDARIFQQLTRQQMAAAQRAERRPEGAQAKIGRDTGDAGDGRGCGIAALLREHAGRLQPSFDAAWLAWRSRIEFEVGLTRQTPLALLVRRETPRLADGVEAAALPALLGAFQDIAELLATHHAVQLARLRVDQRISDRLRLGLRRVELVEDVAALRGRC
jgi:hypothetical protein